MRSLARPAGPALLALFVGAAALVGPPAATAAATTAAVPPPPKVHASAYVVADAGTGEILAARRPHTQYPPASTLKTLTALTVAPNLDPKAVHVATRADVDVEGSRAGLVPEGTYTIEQLFQALFLRSGNDAATALANANGGVPATVEAMNATAAALGAVDTHAVNPTGLDEPGQVSSAYDLALFGQAALKVPALMSYAGTISTKFPGKPAKPGHKRKTFELWTQQKFVTNYDGALGIKNGYTTQAHNTLITAARRGERTILVTLLKGDAGTWKEAAALSDWAFAYADRVTPVGRLGAAAAQESAATPAAHRAAAGTGDGASAASPTSSTAAGGSSYPRSLVLFTLTCLLGAVAALRARVLLRRRRRRLPR
jgi:D-alanyl-D-alanine carboxypeptidase (penicillin-binding protein 5/6)